MKANNMPSKINYTTNEVQIELESDLHTELPKEIDQFLVYLAVKQPDYLQGFTQKFREYKEYKKYTTFREFVDNLMINFHRATLNLSKLFAEIFPG